MRFYVAITDFDWFTYLAAQQPDEVNFWQPSGSNQFRAIGASEPLLFKLHSPRNFIVGGGFLSRFTILPLSLAWAAFGQKNGAKTFDEMRERVWKYKESPLIPGQEEAIGCIMLQQPFFFPEEQWIPLPNWAKSIVRGKTFDTDEQVGASLWAQVEERLATPLVLDESVLVAQEKFGQPQVVLPRLGQGSFRVLVTETYKRQCAISSSHVLPTLDAAHIRPYAHRLGSHSPTNGLLLRNDIHALFDRGYLTVTPDYHVEVSRMIKAEFNNGLEYYAMHGNKINLPEYDQFNPSRDALKWHNEQVFRS
ncbi:MAG TPA: HNH endonuclease [Terriglobales bacterium]|nr:HNH endonuclease [Terriglobales bacterium]